MFYGVDTEEMLIVMVGILLVAYLFLILIGIASYIMNAMAFQRIASKRLIKDAWLAWIPIASSWLIGSIADEYDEKNGIKRRWRAVLLTLSLIAKGGIVAAYVGMIASGIMMSTQLDFMETGYAEFVGGFMGAYVLLLVAAVVASAQNICNLICLYKTFESTVPEKAVKYLLVSLLVPLGKSICLLKCRNQGYEKVLVPNPVSSSYSDTVQPVVAEPTEKEESFTEEAVEEVNAEEIISEE